MTDYIIRAIDENQKIRFFIADTTEMVEEARQIHGASTTASAAMGRLLTMAVISSMEIQNEGESISFTIKGNGPGGMMVAVTDEPGSARVYAQHPEIDIPSRESDNKLDVGGWVGKDGTLTVVRGYTLKEPFSGVTELVSGEIAEDFVYYFQVSEQRASVVSLGVFVEPDYHVSASGGLFIQLMPDVSEEEVDRLEEIVQDLPSMTQMLGEGMSPEMILEKYFSAFNPKILEQKEVEYKCPCSREKMERALRSLPNKDLVELAEEDGGAEIICQFCNEQYQFTADDLLAFTED